MAQLPRTEISYTRALRRAAGITFSASFLLLAACGGGGNGGGGPGSPPPPPPPPAGSTNAAPILRATVDDAAPQEGQYFTLDASGTTDADNDPLTFSWVQTAGPHVDIPDPTLATLTNLRVPELTETKVAKFRVQVEDGKAARSVYVDVTFTNIHQMPRLATEPPLAGRMAVNGNVEAMFRSETNSGHAFLGIAQNPSGVINLSQLAHPNDSTFALLPLAQTLAGLSQPALFQPTSNLAINLNLEQFFLLSEEQGRVAAYVKPDAASPFFEKGYLDVDAPCAINDEPESSRFIIGQRHGGFTVVDTTDIDPDTGDVTFAVHQTVAGDQSFCAVQTAYYPLAGATHFPANRQFLDDLIAYDVDANAVYAFREDGGATKDLVMYELAEYAEIDLGTDEPLTFVKATGLGARGLALLFTDGQHEGTHRLVVVGLDKDRKLVQEWRSWTTGVPSDVLENVFPGKLVVTTSTSPDAVVFSTSFGTTVDEYFPLTGPEFFEIGLGANLATEIVLEAAGALSALDAPFTHFLMVSDPEDHDVRFYGLGADVL